jgi:hypothetical protein
VVHSQMLILIPSSQAPSFRHHYEQTRYRDLDRELGVSFVVGIRSDTGVGLASVSSHSSAAAIVRMANG